MKVMVTVKPVIDPYARIRIADDEMDVVRGNMKIVMNPFDEIALEEAIRMKESGVADEVVVLSIGSGCTEMLRTALAMGADSAIEVETDEKCPPILVAKYLKEVVTQVAPGLLLMGKQAVDGDHNQTGQMTAALLGWGQGTFVSRVTMNDGEVTVIREVDGGLETIQLPLPCVLTADLRLNEPRYPSLPNIMKAKSKPLKTIPAADLGVSHTNVLTRLKVEYPPEPEGGELVDSVSELVERLADKEKVLL